MSFSPCCSASLVSNRGIATSENARDLGRGNEIDESYGGCRR